MSNGNLLAARTLDEMSELEKEQVLKPSYLRLGSR